MTRLLFVAMCLLFSQCVSALDDADREPVIELLTKLKDQYSEISAYSAVMKLENFKDNRELQRQKVWYKKPGYLLIEQLGPYKEGARLAILPDGTIKGHLGGFFSFMVAPLKPDDENLFGVTNDSAFTTDFGAIINIAFDLAKKMTKFNISGVAVNGRNQIVLETHFHGEFERYRLFIDSEKMLIVRLERYSDNRLAHRISWFEVNTNIKIDDKKFKL